MDDRYLEIFKEAVICLLDWGFPKRTMLDNIKIKQDCKGNKFGGNPFTICDNATAGAVCRYSVSRKEDWSILMNTTLQLEDLEILKGIIKE